MVLPILLIVALGLVQAGLFVRDQLVLVEAARAGAREASVSADDGTVRAAVDRAAATLAAADLAMEVDRSGQQGQPVSVRLVYTDPVVIPVVRWLFPPSVELSAAATMRQEYR
jgi:Flp pilus assembly protein TadG